MNRKKHLKNMVALQSTPFIITETPLSFAIVQSERRKQMLKRFMIGAPACLVTLALIWFLSQFEEQIINATTLGVVAVFSLSPLILCWGWLTIRKILGLSPMDSGYRIVPMEGDVSIAWLLSHAKKGSTEKKYLDNLINTRPELITMHEFRMMKRFIEREF